MSTDYAPERTLSAGCWQVDVDNSAATFTVRNLGRLVHGSVPFIDGVVEIGDDGRPRAISGSLDISGIMTGIPKRDKDLRSPRLLDLDNHPVMTFTADRLAGWQVEGVLAARGTSTRVAGIVEQTDGDDESVTLRATTSLDLRSLGIRAPRIMIGRHIAISVEARLTLALVVAINKGETK